MTTELQVLVLGHIGMCRGRTEVVRVFVEESRIERG
jgi:hypothetical protein